MKADALLATHPLALKAAPLSHQHPPCLSVCPRSHMPVLLSHSESCYLHLSGPHSQRRATAHITKCHSFSTLYFSQVEHHYLCFGPGDLHRSILIFIPPPSTLFSTLTHPPKLQRHTHISCLPKTSQHLALLCSRKGVQSTF